jgi:hypothetical protein
MQYWLIQPDPTLVCRHFFEMLSSPRLFDEPTASTMMKRRRPWKVTLHYTLTTIGFTIFLLADSIQSQFVFPSSSGPCPSNPEMIGYMSVEDLNADMNTELQRITDGGSQPESYFLLLCPETTFSTFDDPLMPTLNRATFSCGETGDVNQNCIFSGGEQNIRVRDPGVEGYIFNTMNFIGLTFQAFTDQSINLRGIAPTEAVFMDCVWQVRSVSFTRLLRHKWISILNNIQSKYVVF